MALTVQESQRLLKEANDIGDYQAKTIASQSNVIKYQDKEIEVLKAQLAAATEDIYWVNNVLRYNAQGMNVDKIVAITKVDKPLVEAIIAKV